MSQQFEPLLTDEQVGEMLAMTPRAVQHLARTGQLPARKVGRYWRFRRSWIEHWLEGHNAEETTVSTRIAQAPQGRTH